MGPKRILVIAMVALAGLFMAACSDDAEALSKAEFIEQADAICQEVNDELEPIWEEFWSGLEDWDIDDPAAQEDIFAGFAAVVEEGAPAMEQQVADLRELNPPSDDREMLDELLDDLDSALTEMSEVSIAAAAGDTEARERMDDTDPMADVNQQAREYGLAVCGAEE